MKKKWLFSLFLILFLSANFLTAQEGLIPAFKLQPPTLHLERLSRPGSPFHKIGRRFALLAEEGGSFEAWAYPLKLVRNFEISFFVGSSTRPIKAKDIVHSIRVSPEATILTFVYQSFTAQAIYITPIDLPGAIILLKVDTTEPLIIVCGFLPVLQPMWPAGLGGQYAYWNDKHKAYFISEPAGKNQGIVGSQAASGISYTPAHMLSDAPSEFKIEIPDPEKARNAFIPICLAGGKGRQEDILKVYEQLSQAPEQAYRKTREHYQNLLDNTLNIQTPDQTLNQAFDWAKITFDDLMVDNPDLGKGLVAGWGASGTSGRPGFGWFFGGDAFINSFSILSYGGFEAVREALAFTQKWQREDGKMAHELSQAAGYIDWWKDYHYGYIHGDTTPFYIVALSDYMRMSGDLAFLEESWISLEKAFAWCLSTDANQDGLMDNKRAGLGALEYGALTGIETDIYLAAIWTRACLALKHLAEASGKTDLAKKAGEYFQKAQKAFDEKFWDGESQFYAYAFNADGKRVRETSPWSSVGLMWGLGTPVRSLASLKKLISSDLATDWGIRSLSVKSQYFQPLNYNYGAVWPFLSGWVTTALYKHHLPLPAYSLLSGTARHTFHNNLGCITEVFSGTQNIWPQEAVSQQGFSSAGVVLPLVRGLLGLEGDALTRTLFFAPHLPADWKSVFISNFRIGQAAFSLDYRRERDKIKVLVGAKNAGGFKINFAPALGLGSTIQSLSADGEKIDFQTFSSGQVVQASAEFPLENKNMLIEIDFVPALEILPVVIDSPVGERNRGLKIISAQKEARQLIIEVEGLAGEAYELRVLNSELIDRLEGAELKEERLRFQIPSGNPGEFVSYTIKIWEKASL